MSLEKSPGGTKYTAARVRKSGIRIFLHMVWRNKFFKRGISQCLLKTSYLDPPPIFPLWLFLWGFFELDIQCIVESLKSSSTKVAAAATAAVVILVVSEEVYTLPNPLHHR